MHSKYPLFIIILILFCALPSRLQTITDITNNTDSPTQDSPAGDAPNTNGTNNPTDLTGEGRRNTTQAAN